MSLKVPTLIIIWSLISMNANAWEYQGIQPIERQTLLKEVKAKSGAKISQEPGILRIEIREEKSIYFFTTEGHPAHPAVVIQKIIQENGNLMIETSGYTAGDRKIFEEWLNLFNQQTSSK